MPSPSTLRIEKYLAGAHKMLWSAQSEAERAGLLGLEEDLFLLTEEVRRLTERTLKGDKTLRATRRVRA